MKKLFLKKYKCTMQHDSSDCAAAVLSTVLRTYKIENSITQLRDIMGTDINGTTVYGLVQGAKKVGFTTKAVNVNDNDVFSEYSLPAIANIHTSEGMNHFVVIHKIKEETLIIADPAQGVKEISKEEFIKTFNNILVLLVPSSLNENSTFGGPVKNFV